MTLRLPSEETVMIWALCLVIGVGFAYAFHSMKPMIIKAEERRMECLSYRDVPLGDMPAKCVRYFN